MFNTMIEGKYNLQNASFMLKSNIIASYHDVRYQLKECTRRGPQNLREFSNFVLHHLEM